MADSLAQSLVDAAAEAITAAYNKVILDSGLPTESGHPTLAEDWRDEGRAAALAVLEILSEQTHEFAYLNGGDFQDLADAIRREVS